MNKTGGYILLAAGALLGWFWYRNRAPKAADASSANGLNGVGQVGSNYSTNLTPEIVKLTLDYARQTALDQGPCWKRAGMDLEYHPGEAGWFRSDDLSKTLMWLPIGTVPMTLRPC